MSKSSFAARSSSISQPVREEIGMCTSTIAPWFNTRPPFDMDAVAVKNEEKEEEEEENEVILSSERLTQFLYSIIAGLSGVVIGTAVGWNSPATELLSAKDDTATTNDCDSAVVWNATSYYCLGTVAGGLIQRPLAKCIGYKWSAAVYDMVALIGWLVLLRPDSDWPWSVALGRLVQGLGTGGLGLLIPTYISHITNVDVRGRAQMFHQAFVCFGIFYSYVFGAIMTYEMLISVCMIWPVFHLLITVMVMPESPCFLYTHNDREMLLTVMCQIKGTEYDVHSDYKELKKYMRSVDSSSCDFASTKNAVSKNHGCNVFIIGVGLVMFQQLCGVNLCIFHMEHIFKEFISIDDTSIKPRVILMGVSLLQVLLCLMSIELVEFLGRKCMLITSAWGMCLSVSILHYVLLTQDVVHEGTEWRNNKIIILVILYVSSYSIGWGPVVMLLYTEIVHFDKWYSSLIYAGGQLVIFVMMNTFSDAHALKGTYITCTSILLCIVSIVFLCYFVPETRGMHLNQIQTVLNSRDREEANVHLQQVKVVK